MIVGFQRQCARFPGAAFSALRALAGLVILASCVSASQDAMKQAAVLYQRTNYRGSLQVLAQDPAPDAATYHLMGKNHFMLTDYKKASEFFEKASVLEPGNSDYMLWLGRAYGRRAETANWLTAGAHASKARQCFEKAMALDPHNHEAMNDLFDYYLNAPGFLGGGADKAEAIARRIAEDHLRRAMEMAPHEVGRAIDLARYLARHGRVKESDAVYSQAEKVAPNDPRVAFERAKSYIENRRNLDQARKLLQQYLNSEITPDDPPKHAAEELLQRTTGG